MGLGRPTLDDEAGRETAQDWRRERLRMASKTRILALVLIVAIGVLSIAAGLPKVLQMPQELGFLESIGLTGIAVSILGVVQTAGGMLLLWPRFRNTGALLAGVAFVVSSIAIFAGGDAKFGLVSLLPVPVLAIVMVTSRNPGSSGAA